MSLDPDPELEPSISPLSARQLLEGMRAEWLRPVVDRLGEAERTIGHLEAERAALAAQVERLTAQATEPRDQPPTPSGPAWIRIIPVPVTVMLGLGCMAFALLGSLGVVLDLDENSLASTLGGIAFFAVLGSFGCYLLSSVGRRRRRHLGQRDGQKRWWTWDQLARAAERPGMRLRVMGAAAIMVVVLGLAGQAGGKEATEVPPVQDAADVADLTATVAALEATVAGHTTTEHALLENRVVAVETQVATLGGSLPDQTANTVFMQTQIEDLRARVTVLEAPSGTGQGTTSGDGQGTTSAGKIFPVTPDPAECRVAGRSVEELLAINASVTPTASAPAPTTVEIPLGDPADEETIRAITATMLEHQACIHAADTLRVYAFASEASLRRTAAEHPMPEEDLREALEAGRREPGDAVVPAEQRITILAITDVLKLEDGRVSAFVVLDHPIYGLATSYNTFVHEHDRWLIDEIVQFRPEED